MGWALSSLLACLMVTAAGQQGVGGRELGGRWEE